MKKMTKLLPLQGALLTAIIPRAMPWAKSFWAFSPYLNHMRKFCYFISTSLLRFVQPLMVASRFIFGCIWL